MLQHIIFSNIKIYYYYIICNYLHLVHCKYSKINHIICIHMDLIHKIHLSRSKGEDCLTYFLNLDYKISNYQLHYNIFHNFNCILHKFPSIQKIHLCNHKKCLIYFNFQGMNHRNLQQNKFNILSYIFDKLHLDFQNNLISKHIIHLIWIYLLHNWCIL